MIATTQTPIGEVINFLYKNEFSHSKNNILLREIRNLMDLIIIRTKKEGIKETLLSLEDSLFKLRIDIVRNKELMQSSLKNLQENIKQRIKYQFKSDTNHKQLELAFVNAINIYGKIAGDIIDEIPQSSILSLEHIPDISYNDFIFILESLPGEESKSIINFLKSSISLDYALIVSELIFDNELKLKKSEMDTLIHILKDSIEEYAIYSYQFGHWVPSDDDENQWVRNIKIRISLFESQFITNQNLTSEDISKILVV